eukprot:NODE_738_length_1940_cov_15.010576_g684_i0.p1 GENE.NODE_738_length_1940_cov_15.010576_g684_i0~~NODE_738_length_1940_cov_15.010576_g684_i0.p1  ORF type:complete len:583 (-),score=105.71 NODE_738_length_1940_cov_15.010576_g684_i0:27-1775(-)
MAHPKRGSINFDDLGEPIKRLLREVRHEVDFSLLPWVTVPDLAMVFDRQSSGADPDDIWKELHQQLVGRLHHQQQDQRRSSPSVEPGALGSSVRTLPLPLSTAEQTHEPSCTVDSIVEPTSANPPPSAVHTMPGHVPSLPRPPPLRRRVRFSDEHRIIPHKKLQDRAKAAAIEEAQLVRQDVICLDSSDGPLWEYFDTSANTWRPVPASHSFQMDTALAEGVKVLKLPSCPLAEILDSGVWVVFLRDMVATVPPSGHRVPLRHIARDETSADQRGLVGSGPVCVWSSLNPLSKCWERFPGPVCRALEAKKRFGRSHADVIIMGRLHFRITFSDGMQRSSDGTYRRVQRTLHQPRWERFDATCAWQPLPLDEAQLLELSFAAGEQGAEIVPGWGENDDELNIGATFDFTRMSVRDHGSGRCDAVRRSLVSAAEANPSQHNLRAASASVTQTRVLKVCLDEFEVSADDVNPRELPSLTLGARTRYPLDIGEYTLHRAVAGEAIECLQVCECDEGLESRNPDARLLVSGSGEVYIADCGGYKPTRLLTAEGCWEELPVDVPHCANPGTFIALGPVLIRVELGYPD